MSILLRRNFLRCMTVMAAGHCRYLLLVTCKKIKIIIIIHITKYLLRHTKMIGVWSTLKAGKHCIINTMQLFLNGKTTNCRNTFHIRWSKCNISLLRSLFNNVTQVSLQYLIFRWLVLHHTSHSVKNKARRKCFTLKLWYTYVAGVSTPHLHAINTFDLRESWYLKIKRKRFVDLEKGHTSSFFLTWPIFYL